MKEEGSGMGDVRAGSAQGCRGDAMLRCAALALAMLVSRTVFAQSDAGFPQRVVRIVVPFAAGGGADILSRVLSQKLTEALRQTVLVDNRPGAGTVLGGEIVVKAPADGHTLFMATFVNAVNPALRPDMPWDVQKDLAPVSLLATSSYVLAAHPSLPARTVRELVDLARSRPGQIHFASAGSGTPSHLGGELFKVLVRVDVTHVPYKGLGPALTDVVGGQVALTFGNNIATLPHLRSGRLRGLAVTSARRSALLPDLPTMAESGVAGFEVVGWYGLMAPRATPSAVVNRLYSEIGAALQLADVQSRLKADGSEAVGGGPEVLGRFLAAEIAKWGRVVRENRLRGDG